MFWLRNKKINFLVTLSYLGAWYCEVHISDRIYMHGHEIALGGNMVELKTRNYFVCLFDLILYIPSTIFQLNRDGSSWVEPVLG